MISFSAEGLEPQHLNIWHSGDPSLASWDAEQHIESIPHGSELALPPLSWFRERVPDVETLHLRMMVRIRNEGGELFQRFPSLIGNPHPTILLLGDVHNPNNDPWYRAAFGPWAGSGVWLLEALMLLSSTQLDSVALANAGEDNPALLVEALGHPGVVALGREAQRYCYVAGVDAGVLPHPQYARRFLNRKRQQYANAAVEASVSGDDLLHSIGGK